MAFKLFGWEFVRQKQPELAALIPQTTDDGALTIQGAGEVFGTYLDLDGTVRTEAELIARYREMAEHPEVEAAVDDIVNESIVVEDDRETVQIVLDNLQIDDRTKDIFKQEFKTCLDLLQFDSHPYEIYRRWYVDGRLYYQVLIDNDNPTDGIQQLRYIDPRKIRKIREVKQSKDPSSGTPTVKTVNEYYIFDDKGFSSQAGVATSINPSATSGVRIAPDSILHCTSGITSIKGDVILSYLHKAIKPLNQLRSLEDSLVIYRLSRAPERRIFYIDVGNLPKMKAEQYLRDIQVRFKNRIVYDSSTGEIRDDRKFMCYILDTKIPLLDGRTLTLQEIINEYNSGKTNWVYSCDPKTGKFEPGLISWAGITKENSDVTEVTLDNEKSLICTLDHKFPVWDKGLIEAQNLTIGESIIPGYRRYKSIQTNGIEYEQIYKNDTQTWEFTHREVNKWKNDLNINEEFIFSPIYKNSSKTIIHHKDFNRFNNSPDNLVMMNYKDHMKYHHDIQNIEYTDEIFTEVEKCAKSLLSINNVINIINNIINIHQWKMLNIDKNPKNRNMNNLCFTYKDLLRICKNKGFNNWKQYQKKYDLRLRENNGRLKRGSCIKFSNEYKEKLRIAAKNRQNIFCKSWKITNPKGVIIIIDNLNDFCKKNNLNRSNIKYNHSKGYRAEILHNHKVVSVKLLDEKMTVGALTIDQNETYHSHHTYLLDVGIYTKNTMLEDFWLPRREGGRGTQIETLPGGQNLNQIDDIIFFQRKLFRSLNIPITRLDPEAMFNYGRANEITRDEVKFSKFIGRLRHKFAMGLFLKCLGKQLILKGIVTPEEWDVLQTNIKFKFMTDSYFEELKDAEILQERLGVANLLMPYVGRYYSNYYVRKNVFRQEDDDMKEEDQLITSELQNPQFQMSVDPLSGQPMSLQQLLAQEPMESKVIPQQPLIPTSGGGSNQGSPVGAPGKNPGKKPMRTMNKNSSGGGKSSK